MKLGVIGAENQTQVNVIDEASRFFAKELMHGNLVNNLEVDVWIEDDEGILDDSYGICDPDVPKDSRKFDIYLREELFKDEGITFAGLKVLAHEFVHVKQFARGDLFFTVDDDAMYYGKKVSSKRMERMNYLDRAWEKEAENSEIELVIKFLSKTKCVVK